MAKKTFGSGFDSLLAETDLKSDTDEESEEKVKNQKLSTVKPEEKLTNDSLNSNAEFRTSVYMSEELYEKVQAIAYWERQKIKDILNEAVTQVLKKKGTKYIEQALNAYRNR